MTDVVAAYDSIAVYVSCNDFDCRLLYEIDVRDALLSSHRRHIVPVCYEFGEDLTEVTERMNLAAEKVVALHTGNVYRCYAVGFSPGFPYLGYLPEPLQGVPRRATPRREVPPGSVAIAGKQTGIYPQATPGGWFILGRTPLCLVDVAADYFPIRAGDEVVFTAIGPDEFELRRGERLP